MLRYAPFRHPVPLWAERYMHGLGNLSIPWHSHVSALLCILSRHQVYLCKELCVLERKFWLEFGVKGKVSHQHTIFMINMLTGIKLRKKRGNKNLQLALQHFYKMSWKTTLRVLPPTNQTCVRGARSESHARRKEQEEKTSLTVSAMIF